MLIAKIKSKQIRRLKLVRERVVKPKLSPLNLLVVQRQIIKARSLVALYQTIKESKRMLIASCMLQPMK